MEFNGKCIIDFVEGYNGVFKCSTVMEVVDKYLVRKYGRKDEKKTTKEHIAAIMELLWKITRYKPGKMEDEPEILIFRLRNEEDLDNEE